MWARHPYQRRDTNALQNSPTLNLDGCHSLQTSDKAPRRRKKDFKRHSPEEKSPVAKLILYHYETEIKRESERKESEKERGRVNVEKKREEAGVEGK